MKSLVIEYIVKTLNESYCQMEDMLGEHDITKDDFLEAEKLIQVVAQSIGVNEFYPFKVD